MPRTFLRASLLLVAGLAADAALIPDVRQAIAEQDFAKAERLIQEHRTAHGKATPEMIAAYSWLGRGALANKDYDKAEMFAVKTKALAVAELKKRKLDEEPHLPIALGAAIEVQAQVSAARGERDQAVQYLGEELAAYRNTSIRTRIQKNLNLLTLEGKKAPALERVYPAAMAGKPVLLFFWAHWCGDCKATAPVLGRLKQQFGPKGLVIVAPTQQYGYAESGREVAPAEEAEYIGKVRREFYPQLDASPIPVSAENFKNYGSSTTPTIVLVDKAGIVRLYHPGKMTYEELAPKITELLKF